MAHIAQYGRKVALPEKCRRLAFGEFHFSGNPVYRAECAAKRPATGYSDVSLAIPMPSKKIVISRHFDPDFGSLELIETRFEASVKGRPLTALSLREWTGKLDDLDATLSISNTDNPPKVPDEIRAAFRAVVSDVGGFKRRIARRELELARSWSAQGSMDLELDEEKFVGLLEIEGFTLGDHRLTVWLRETANIFAGHAVEVRIERGVITEVCLAG